MNIIDDEMSVAIGGNPVSIEINDLGVHRELTEEPAIRVPDA